MSFDIRHPNINGSTDTEQLQQIRSYLYQLAPQLNWALNTLETAGSAQAFVAEKPKASSVSSESREKINNFNELKAYVIKSAEIVNAFYDEITRTLVGEYKAVAENIGSYEQTTAQDIVETSEGIRQVFGNIQKLEGVFKDGKDSVTLIKTNAYVKTGVLYNESNGTPVYGIEVGQITDNNGEIVYNGMARFTPKKLSFFGMSGQDNEVAYISNQQFYITRGEIVESLRIGGYLMTAAPNTGLAFKWVGYDIEDQEGE